MAVFDAPVCFTRAAPVDAYSGQLVFYDVVESNIVEGCEVLSCIAEAGGDVVLPESIRLPEFKRWLVAIKSAPEKLKLMTFSIKCEVLKVADALGDSRVDDWLTLAAEHLHELARDRRHQRSSAAEKAAESLSIISDSLQQRLLATEAREPGQLHTLLNFLPSHLHSAVVAAAVSPTNALAVPLYDHPLPFVKALSSMPPFSPALLSLDVHHGPLVKSPDEFQQKPLQCPAWQDAAPHVAAALRKQSLISQLRLDLMCIKPASARLLAPAIATLKSLQSLHLTTCIDADTTHALQQTLQELPQLQHLSLALTHVPASLKRSRDQKSKVAASCSLTDLLAPATQLTSLQICAHANRDTDCFAFTSPRGLPHTSQLKVDNDRPEHALGAVLSATPPALAALRQLQNLDVSARHKVLLEALKLLRAGARGLTHLRLKCLNRCKDIDERLPWKRFAKAVAWLRLQSLVLELQYPSLDELPGLSVLCARELSRLTALRMNGWACMHSEADVAALARMTHLQKLQFIATEVGYGQGSSFSRAMQSLPALTSLALTFEEDASFADVLVEELEAAAPPAWPELRELSVEVWKLHDVLRLVTAGPKLTRLTLDKTGWSFVLSEDDEISDDEWEQVEARAAAEGVSVSIEPEFPF